MSNGDPPPNSTAAYIIICSIRTEILAAKDSTAKIVTINRGAAQLCSFIESNRDVNPADFHPISVLQHELMDGMLMLKKHEVDSKVGRLFELFDALEDKYPS